MFYLYNWGATKERLRTCNLHQIKHVNDIVNQCLFAPTVESALNVVETLPVKGRLHNFSQEVSILIEGYTLPIKIRPLLTRHQLSRYANPVRTIYLKDVLLSVQQKLSGFLLPPIFGPYTNQQVATNSRVEQRHCLTFLTQHAEDTPGQSRQGTHPSR